MNGFKITNINFSQAVTLPPGTYTYSCSGVKPVSTILTFKIGTQTFVVENLLAGVFQAGFRKTFTLTTEATVFYPARTIGDIVYEPQIETGTNASDPGPNPLDIDEAIESAGIEITSEIARIYATKSDVSAEILVIANEINMSVENLSGRVSTFEQTVEHISLSVDDLTDDLLATGIDIENKIVKITANKFTIVGNDGTPYAVFELVNGVPKLKAGHIDAESLAAIVVSAERINALDITSKRLVSLDELGNKIATVNEFGDGAYIQYYQSGRKRMELGGGAIIYYNDNTDNTIKWVLGESGTISTQSLDRWVEIYLVATDSTGSNVKKQALSVGGTMYKRFAPGASSIYTSYINLTVNSTVNSATTPNNVPSASYIPNGWYTAPVIAYTYAGDPENTYRRKLRYYSNGIKTQEVEISFIDSGYPGLPTE